MGTSTKFYADTTTLNVRSVMSTGKSGGHHDWQLPY